jgi:hypothetical protein
MLKGKRRLDDGKRIERTCCGSCLTDRQIVRTRHMTGVGIDQEDVEVRGVE